MNPETIIQIQVVELLSLLAAQNNFIYFSFKGYFFEKTKNLIISLVEGGEKEIMTDALKVLSPGETSGADFAAGLIGSLQDFYR